MALHRVREAAPADADFLRAALVDLDSEVRDQATAAGVDGEGAPALDVEFHLKTTCF